MDKLILDMGLRYDSTEITSANVKQQANDYDELNGYIYATYNADDSRVNILLVLVNHHVFLMQKSFIG